MELKGQKFTIEDYPELAAAMDLIIDGLEKDPYIGPIMRLPYDTGYRSPFLDYWHNIWVVDTFWKKECRHMWE